MADNARQQDELRGRISEAENHVLALDAEIESAQREIGSLDGQIRAEQAQIRLLARALYYRPSSILMMVATARTARDLVAEAADLIAAGTRASEIERRIAAQRAEVAAQRNRAEAARAEQVRVRENLRADLSRLDELRSWQADSARQLIVTGGQTQAEAAELDRQSAEVAARITERLQQEQERIISEAMQRAWAQGSYWIAANPGVPGLSAGHSQRYRFVWPEARASISQGYGPTTLALEPPYMGFAHFHTGLDLAAPEGTPVLAADDGAVAAVGEGSKGYGRYLILSHRDGLATLYGHLAQPLVRVGDQVVQGQPVGLEGSTGDSTGPHVHFELRVNGQVEDPSALLPPGSPSDYRDHAAGG
jgi:murein DD-endopeptidase MepM/ murein hydrolase activator NlpD